MKHLVVLCLFLLNMLQVSAQENFYGIFNRVGANLGVGTEGVTVGIATPLTPYLEMSMGLNIVPKINVKGTVDVQSIYTSSSNISIGDVDVKGNFARTTFDFKVNCYPFGSHSTFFVATGLSFGGKTLAKLHGHSPDVEAYLAAYPNKQGDFVASVGKYNIAFDENGDVDGTLDVKGVRPYVGLGFGRLIPKHRVGARFELGCQFHGKVKVMQNNQEVQMDNAESNDDDFSKIVDKIRIYPVMKLSIVGRIL
ncbi:MAG: hypothetical protein I3J02_07360 [Prevotella sp.]|nr:hypothetical protein [Prevotella sp.]